MGEREFKPGDVVSYKMIHQTGLNDYAFLTRWHHGIVVESSRAVTVITTVLDGVDKLFALRTEDAYGYQG